MTATVAIAGLLGAGVGLGLLLIPLGLLGPAHDTGTANPVPVSQVLPGRGPGGWRRLAACVAVGVMVGAVTRWPVAAMLATCAAWTLPGLAGPDREHKRRLARIEAIATWTESLRDTLSAAAGLEQAIDATSGLAPEPIREEVGRLAGRIRRGQRLPEALRAFAVDLDDATGDLVVAALVMAAERNARHVCDLLGALATAAREQASLRMRVAAGRARVRTSTRVILVVTLVMAAGLMLLNRDYLAPYDSAPGQLVLVLVGLLFAAGFGWLSRIARMGEPEPVIGPGAGEPVAAP
jgi:Flp pilus assembly protein TadB